MEGLTLSLSFLYFFNERNGGKKGIVRGILFWISHKEKSS